jgi:SHAQKYF class myb-like DNA-binding protein
MNMTADAVDAVLPPVEDYEDPKLSPYAESDDSVMPPIEINSSEIPSDTEMPEPAATLGKPLVVTGMNAPAARRPSLVSSKERGNSVDSADSLSRTVSSSKSKKKKSGPPAVTMATASVNQPTPPGALGENTGRWTAEEHRLFLQGLEQHGKGWKKIASLIKSRTVVQIRTHAQKYFQKLAKARQNGEEGEVIMEGRGGSESVTHVPASPTNKRRRQITGTKRKAIQSVVSSAQRQGKKMMAAQAAAGVPNPVAPLPAISPALAHFLLPSSKSGCTPSITTAQGNISGPALEDSLYVGVCWFAYRQMHHFSNLTVFFSFLNSFRFLTPVPVATSQPQVNDVARQAGANPITLPSSNPSTAPTITSGEISPTGVQDLAIYPSWTDAKDPPSWYSKGGDVDALLDVADTLDWLTDTGDINESYQPPVDEEADDEQPLGDSTKMNHPVESTVNNSTSVNTLPDVDHHNVDSVVPPLPSLFGGSRHPSENPIKEGPHLEGLHASPSEIDMSHLQVFDTPMEEHDFVSTILETTAESTDHLSSLS